MWKVPHHLVRKNVSFVSWPHCLRLLPRLSHLAQRHSSLFWQLPPTRLGPLCLIPRTPGLLSEYWWKFIFSRPMRHWDTRILKSMYFSLSLVWKIIDQSNIATNWEPFYLQNGGRHCLVELNFGCLCNSSVHVSTGLQLWYRVSKTLISCIQNYHN